jgi:hypothetical protein
MSFDFEGDLLLERAHTRRWVSIIAVVIPVAAFVLAAAWFIRAFIVPPTVAIHNPAMMADTPPAPPAVPKRAMVEAPKPALPVAVAAAPVQAPVKEMPAPFALPMFATLSAAPPSLPSTSPAFADPAQDPTPAVSPAAAPITPPVSETTASPVTATETAELEPGEPIAGSIPVPRAKPHGSLAALHGPVPLPRPKPTELAPEPDLPAVDRHSIN